MLSFVLLTTLYILTYPCLQFYLQTFYMIFTFNRHFLLYCTSWQNHNHFISILKFFTFRLGKYRFQTKLLSLFYLFSFGESRFSLFTYASPLNPGFLIVFCLILIHALLSFLQKFLQMRVRPVLPGHSHCDIYVILSCQAL